MSKVIISVAVTGAIHTPSMSDNLPITPQEIAALASALNLSKDGAAKLAGYTARSGSLSLDEARAALSQAGQSLVADATQRKASDTKLMALVGQYRDGHSGQTHFFGLGAPTCAPRLNK